METLLIIAVAVQRARGGLNEQALPHAILCRPIQHFLLALLQFLGPFRIPDRGSNESRGQAKTRSSSGAAALIIQVEG